MKKELKNEKKLSFEKMSVYEFKNQIKITGGATVGDYTNVTINETAAEIK